MKNKKAFTVVELVIVIAIIAILAAVLIPTFASIIKKANVSKDQQLIRNLNTALVSDRAENGGKNHRNMTEALEAAEKFGYEVGKINASGTDNEILWDSKNDVFCYYDAEKKTVEYIPSSVSSANIPEKNSTDYWCIITEKNVDEAFITDSQTGVTTLSCGKEEAGNAMKWSCYLAAVKSGVTAITTATGVDVGETTDLETINYVNSAAAQTVIIRTNGGILKINAAEDTVKHFGEADFLDIEAIGTSSYNEFGLVVSAQIKVGRVINEVFEDGLAGIQNLFLIAKDADNDGTADSFDTIIIGAAPGAKLPTFDRTDVAIGDGVRVCEIQTGVNGETIGTKEWVWLFGDGTIASSKVVVTDSDSKPSDTGTINTATASGKAGYELANIPGQSKPTLADLTTAATLFAGGAGTKGNPYLISNEDWWKKFAELCENDTDFSETIDKYFRVTSDIDVSKYESGTLNILYFAGNIDFGNHKIYGWHDEIIGMATNQYFGMFDIFRNATIENCNFYTFSVEDTYTFPITHSARGTRCEIRNCNVYGNCDPVNWNNTGFFATYPKCATLIIENCNNYANLVNSGYSSAFVGRLLGDDMDLYFINCNNYANIISTTAGASMLLANPTLWANDPSIYNIHTDNCNNYGVICGQQNYMTLVVSTEILYPSPSYNTFKVNDVAINTDGVSQQVKSERINGAISGSLMGSNVAKLTVSSLNTNDGCFVLPEIAGAVRYAVSFGFTPSDRLGARAGYTLSFTDLPSNLKVGNWTSNGEIENQSAIVKHNEYGTTFYTYGDSYVYFSEKGGTIQSEVIATFVAFDESGNILYMATYTYSNANQN